MTARDHDRDHNLRDHAPHVCDYREPDGTTAGACHLEPVHGGRCPDCGLAAPSCAHAPSWERVLLCTVPGCAVHL